MKFKKQLFIVSTLILIALSSGCGTKYSTKKTDPVKLFRSQEQNALNSSEISLDTEQILRLLYLKKDYKEQPLEVIKGLQDRIHQSHDPKLEIAVAELALLQGRTHAARDRDTSSLMYMAAAEQAWDYIFSAKTDELHNPLSPTYRFMTNIYNRAVARLIEGRSTRENPWQDRSDITIGNTTYNLKIVKQGSGIWNPEHFDIIKPANQFQVKGIKNQYITHGLGTPLVGLVWQPRQKPYFDKYQPKDETSFPITAILKFKAAKSSSTARTRQLSLTFYDTLVEDSITINDRPIPLESDFTTPLAMLLSNLRNPDRQLDAMLSGEKYLDDASIFMLEPYRPEKIPVIMVHGLMSSPMTWVDMFNDLRGDPEIRDNYQFWMFQYPTGLPILYSANIFRQSLKNLRDYYDPDGTNPNFDKSVIVAHSLGGLLTRMVDQDSKTVYWDNIFTEPFDSADLDDREKDFLKPIAFFDRVDYIDRIVFIATPHRGSKMADSLVAKLGDMLIKQPPEIVTMRKNLAHLAESEDIKNPEIFKKNAMNAVAQLSPKSNVLKSMNDIPITEEVPYHSIIGIRKGTQGPGSSDGLVEYKSSHLDGAQSEVLVPSDHYAHKHPIAINEVKRILKKHLETEKIAQTTLTQR